MKKNILAKEEPNVEFVEIIKKKETQRDPEEIRSENFGKSKDCISCYITKEVTTSFTIHTNTYRNQCKTCLGEAGTIRMSEWRTKQKEENPVSYLKKYADMASKWRAKNPEIAQILTDKQKMSIGNKIREVKQEGIEFLISDEVVEQLIQENCFYCDKMCGYTKAVTQDLDPKDVYKKDPEVTFFNGINRINSNLSYTIDNVISCCSICNFIKNTCDIASFIQRSRTIYLYNNKDSDLQEYSFHDNNKFEGRSGSYYYYKYSANKKSKEFDLDETYFFKELVNKECYLCGYSKNQVGIDRIINSKGYTKDNCAPCCGYCNYSKRNYSLQTFLKTMENITKYSISDKHMDLCKSSKFRKHLIKKNKDIAEIPSITLDD